MGFMRFNVIVLLTLMAVSFSACLKKESVKQKVSGGKSAVFSVDSVIQNSTRRKAPRSAAMLGIFVSEYLSGTPLAFAAEGSLKGVDVQSKIISAQTSVTDPDFDLLQAFADALEVDVVDLLNRSVDRQASLDAYSDALTNVATKAADRFKELNSVLTELKQAAKDQNKEMTAFQRNLKKALDSKDFQNAGELQKKAFEAQEAYSQTSLKQKEVQQLLDTMDKLLELYGQKILAIQQNREILISGNRVVDVPGIDDLKIIQRIKKPGTS